MDPDKALEEIRQLCRTSPTRLAELVSGLDEWMSRGGFLPAEWEAGRARAARGERAGRYDVVEGTPPMPRGERRG